MLIAIIEDEARIARRLERIISHIFENQDYKIFVASDLEQGKNLIKTQEVDLLFLDLNLNGQDGFDVLENVVAESFHTIIVSAYKDKAIRAFEYGVLDFVPKPFDESRLQKAIERMHAKVNTETNIKYLSIKKMGKVSLINVDDILYIKGAGVYTELILKSGRKEIHSKSLESLSAILPPNFVRIHKSYIADMHQALQIIVEPGSQYYLSLKDEVILPIGRTRYKELKAQWFT